MQDVFLIRYGLDHLWADLHPYSQKISATLPLNGRFHIFGEFSAAGDWFANHTPDWQNIRTNEKNIEFHRYGEYYLYSSHGPFKILCLDSTETEIETLIRVFTFLSRNIVHSKTDINTTRSTSSLYQPTQIFEKLFLSDLPIGLYCGETAAVTASVFEQLGYSVRIVNILANNNQGHLINEVYIPNHGWVMIDVDYGRVAIGKNGKLLSTDAAIHEAHTNAEATYIQAPKAYPEYSVDFGKPCLIYDDCCDNDLQRNITSSDQIYCDVLKWLSYQLCYCSLCHLNSTELLYFKQTALVRTDYAPYNCPDHVLARTSA